MPNYALGQQVSKEDERILASHETLPSPDGNGYIRGYLVRPFSADSRNETPAQLPGVIVIHENRGLNPHTEDVARRFALANFMAFAPDALTTVGGYPGDDYQGGQLFRTIDGEKMTADFVAAARSLSGAGMTAQPGRDMPSPSASEFIVVAVPIVLQWPMLGDEAATWSSNSSNVILPSDICLRPSQIIVPEPANSPLCQPSSIGPPDCTIAGRFIVAAAIKQAGVVLSQPVVSTTPSNG